MGDGLTEEVQKKATKGTLFIPMSQFPTKKLRKDCFYHNTPAMAAPSSLENVDSCEVSDVHFPFDIDQLFLGSRTICNLFVKCDRIGCQEGC